MKKMVSDSSFHTNLTIKDCLREATNKLKNAGIEDVRFNSNLLACKALGIRESQLPLHWNDVASDEFIKNLSDYVDRRCSNEPLQYIIGEWSFLDLDIKVGTGALIPRPETEEVFLAAKDAIIASKLPADFHFADVGTGTGILGISMAKAFPSAIGVMVDISEQALTIAEQNVSIYSDLKPRLKLLHNNLLEGFGADSIDVIISNPPYIDSDEVKTLMPEVADYEPHLALDGGVGGLVLIDILIRQAESVLKNHGLLIFEHGHGQREAIRAIIGSKWKILKEGDDFAGKERYFVIQLQKGDC